MSEISEEIKKDHSFDPDVIIAEEKKYLNLNETKPVSGFAISGGGIRSASFGLGVMQALVANKQMSKMDYMSTVSGGGFLGSALTWALHCGGKAVGTDPENFPLGKRRARGGKNESAKITSVFEDENKLLDFIRQHGSYLTPTKNLDILSFAGVIVRSMIMSLFVYISFLTVLMTSCIWLIYFLTNSALNSDADQGIKDGVLLMAGIGLLLLMVLLGFFYSLTTYFKYENISTNRYKNFINGQIMLGWIIKISGTLILFGTLPYVTNFLKDFFENGVAYAAGGSTLFGTATGIWQYLKASKNEENKGGLSDIIIYLGVFALIYGVLLFAYYFSTEFFLNEHGYTRLENPIVFLVFIALTIMFGFFVNLNLIGPHYMWRNRLMEAFMPGSKAIYTNSWKVAEEADKAMMENMCNENNPRPYHIINTNAILANSPKVDYSGRGGDNFIISRLYCGSDATGWRETKSFQKDKTRGMTLASAMATSAAALNPNAGVSGEGVTRNVMVSILLSMLNLRLGYWTSNPAKETILGSPNFFNPGLTSEIFRFGLTENSTHLLLSDGGHYENLALYELIRRKLDLIVVSDGGADAMFNFDDLANAIEKVRVDFGARIYFRQGYGTDQILPRTSGDSLFQQKYEISKHGYAIADIKYSDGKKGVLVYMKLAVIEGLSVDVYSYKGVNPTFPHESTSDQFFNEKQFEAYRELGYYVGWQMMESEDGMKIFPQTT
ncbi:MAG: hypothetical protein IPO27_11050 [Bacteroidetes bacterium]|nr:hypothetical protein [Bacteroidota bacterium]